MKRKINNKLYILMVGIMLTLPSIVFAAPGDTLFSDDFQDGTLAPWTSTNNALSGVDNRTSSTGEGGAGLSMFTFAGDVTVTSPTINAAVGGARVNAWVRKGDDAFSEDPDAVAENLEFEYLNNVGAWQLIQVFDASSLPDGQITNVSFALPANGLHGFLQIRFHQLGGSGGTFDFWHVDDVSIVETSSALTPPPLDLGVCDDFESGIANWTITGAGVGEVNQLAPLLNNNSLSIYSRTVVITSPVIDTSVGLAGLRFDVQRGSDAFSENPDFGENLIVEYLNNVNVWQNIQTYNGNGPQGEFFDDETFTALPADAEHANLQIRFRLTSGNGSTFDYWHVDDVCILAVDAVLQVLKSFATEEDPVNITANPKAIPNALGVYTIQINETAAGFSLNNSVVISDVLPEDVSLFVGDFDGAGSPFNFVDGATGSSLTFTCSSLNNALDDVEFLDAGGAVIATVTPDVDGFASAVRQIRINTGGAFQANGSLSLSYRVRLD